MARIFPFRPYRYAQRAGSLDHLVTQPYDKISPAMRARYLTLSPYNVVRIILGQPYAGAAQVFKEWIAQGILVEDASPAFYAYSQEFSVPDTGEKMLRSGFIGLGAVEDYSAGVVFRHEQTLSGPKKDRLELLRHTHAHFGQIFMLYPDRDLAVDRELEAASSVRPPDATVHDEYGAIHRLWRIDDGDRMQRIQALMSDKKLLIADGHHRYETALAFRDENPSLAGADRVMMTFVNMYSPGLKILATHRVINDVRDFDSRKLTALPDVREITISGLRHLFENPAPEQVRIGLVLNGGRDALLFERERKTGELDVHVLHDELLGGALEISAEAVREEHHITYVRGIDPAVDQVRDGAQAAFLLEPTTVQQVADTSFRGGVMPQKSTDFYPKLLTGLTIYKTGV